MENETPETEKNEFAKDLAKEFASALAVTAGVWSGIVVVGLAASKISEIRKARAAKNNPETTEK